MFTLVDFKLKEITEEAMKQMDINFYITWAI